MVKKQRKFLVGGATVAALVVYLMVTGMKDSMVYYHTPTELVAKTTQDPTYSADRGVKVGGRVLPGSVHFDQRTLDLRFTIVDIENAETQFPVHYNGPLPETFKEGVDVVVEGTMPAGGTFAASTVLTKCGSRYEAGAEAYES